MGPLRFSKCDLYKTITFPAEKGTILVWKGLVKVTFDLPFLNLKGPISIHLKVLQTDSSTYLSELFK